MKVFDIEANGKLEECTKIHSLVIHDIVSGETVSCTDDDKSFTPIAVGLDLLSQDDCLIGHNILGYDIPVLQKIKQFDYPIKPRDTLLMSELICGHERFEHSLAAWGQTLDFPKDEYTGGWEVWTPEMQTYCERDVAVNVKIWEYLHAKNYSEQALEIEHAFKRIMVQQERNGVPFNETKAHELYLSLLTEREQLEAKIKIAVPERVIEKVFIPKRDNKTKGYKKGEPFTKRKTEPFNPGSRQQITQFLKEKYNWQPVHFTPSKNPSLTDEVFSELPYEEAPLFQKYFTIKKLTGYLYEGKEAWLKHVKNGRIHGRVNTCRAVTRRCTHTSPNLSQVPSARKYKGREARELFHAPYGQVMVGCDAKGIELRMLAHYLAPYDGGRYAEIVSDGDIHDTNQSAIGLDNRDLSKRWIYAFFYGAGNLLLGHMVDPLASPEKKKKIGKELSYNFTRNTKGFGYLLRDVKQAAKKGYLVSLDGGRMHVRSDHKALNTLLQGAGALVMKQATIEFWSRDVIQESCQQALSIHDELQWFTSHNHAAMTGLICVESIIESGKYFNLRCPLDAEYKVGETWAETH